MAEACRHTCTGLTNQPDDVEGGVGEDGGVGLIEVVIGLLLASDGLSGHTDTGERVMRRGESVIHVNVTNPQQ